MFVYLKSPKEFDKWFLKELRKINIEIPIGNHYVTLRRAYKIYKKYPEMSASEIFLEFSKRFKAAVYKCTKCRKILLGEYPPTDADGYTYCDKCNKRFLKECDICKEKYSENKLVKKPDGKFICQECEENIRKALDMLRNFH